MINILIKDCCIRLWRRVHILWSFWHRLGWSTQVDMLFVYPLAWEGIGQRMLYAFCVIASMGWVWSSVLRLILCPRWHVMGLVNTG
jgi:hypothetical protein